MNQSLFKKQNKKEERALNKTKKAHQLRTSRSSLLSNSIPNNQTNKTNLETKCVTDDMHPALPMTASLSLSLLHTIIMHLFIWARARVCVYVNIFSFYSLSMSLVLMHLFEYHMILGLLSSSSFLCIEEGQRLWVI
jgi:hypothetical protein